jgi:hypothetical protein
MSVAPKTSVLLDLTQSSQGHRPPRGCRPGAHPSLHLSKGIMETET